MHKHERRRLLAQKDILTFLNNHLTYLQEEYNISKIGLIGSFAREEQTEQSDVDILFEFKLGTKDVYEKKTKLRLYLSTNFDRDVDLCREKYLKPYIRDHLNKEVIYV